MMKQLSKKIAIDFLDKYFSLFVNSYKNPGFRIKIILTNNSKSGLNFFHVQFNKENVETRAFKIVYR